MQTPNVRIPLRQNFQLIVGLLRSSATNLLTSQRDGGLTELDRSTTNSNDPEIGFQYDLSTLGANGTPVVPIQQVFTISMTKTFNLPVAQPTAVSEPTTTALLALGLLGAGFARKRRTH